MLPMRGPAASQCVRTILVIRDAPVAIKIRFPIAVFVPRVGSIILKPGHELLPAREHQHGDIFRRGADRLPFAHFGFSRFSNVIGHTPRAFARW